MKVADLNTETLYCETGPFAYGKEPHVISPNKVQFLDLTSGWGHHYTLECYKPESRTPPHVAAARKARNPHLGDRVEWKQIGMRIANKTHEPRLADLPNNKTALGFYETDDVSPGVIGEIFIPLRSHFLAHRMRRDGNHVEALVNSAAIHRTWEEYEKKNELDARLAEARRVALAPRRFKDSVREVVQYAIEAGYDVNYVRNAVHEEWERTHG